MSFVFFLTVGEDQNIIEVYYNTVVQKVPEDFIHKMLECGWGIGETKRHDSCFKESVLGAECGFPFVTFLDPDIIVSPL